jgi:hypothetical protein
MTFQEEIADLGQRIGKAQSQRDAWRNSGRQENYLEANSLVDALELQLERLQRESQLAFWKNDDPVAAAARGERAQQMAGLSTSYNGRPYQFGADTDRPAPLPEQVEIPDTSQRELMASLDISFADGMYHLGPYRYERLADALNYARLRRLQVRRP